jgi:hypothetical protein
LAAIALAKPSPSVYATRFYATAVAEVPEHTALRLISPLVSPGRVIKGPQRVEIKAYSCFYL